MAKVTLNDHIIADSEICHGKPTFKGTRVMVWQVLSMLASGDDPKEILKAFPGIKMEHLQSALDYAASLTRNNYIVINTGDEVTA